ncbi:DUF4304 domain-containing protein [Pyxidicoccus fallax]|uniref:DUF4304 domain-containing protein n=1 Tax=Pyxidicoccus fallax TaxID=394095 RepID=A0A848LH78_9BACT|nr:DUF4304 domain-containing protein [Pyxidicoccus fallax]NMO15678.1 DUF4304 domain-containing protein [Pyxidicoccus fallax]NPC77085.1 DUF4304 domain-containing protein [Pyxidicoccus fallax]
MDAIKKLTAIATAAMKPLAKAGGFTKKDLTWRRRHGETLQVLNVQRSHGNTASEARCYVNVALSFDALYRLEDRPIPEAPKEHECHFRERMEHLVPGAPSEWDVDMDTDEAVLTARLSEALGRAAAFLDAVDGPAKLLHQHALDYGAQLFLRAQLRYVMGDLDGALADVRGGVEFFADRGLTLERQLRALHLTQLASRAGVKT